MAIPVFISEEIPIELLPLIIRSRIPCSAAITEFADENSKLVCADGAAYSMDCSHSALYDTVENYYKLFYNILEIHSGGML